MSYLPARPLQIQRSYVLSSYFWGALLLATGLAIAAAYVVWQMGDASRITQDQEVWAHGIASEDGSVNGTSRSRYGIFKEYTLNVVYTDNAGATHTDRFSFDTLFGGVNDATQPVLRFDPNHPSRYAISWAIECIGARWASIGFMSIVGALIGLTVMFLGWAMLGRLRLARGLAKDSEEVECAVVSVTEQYANGRSTGNMIYRFVMPPLPPEPTSTGYREAAMAPPTSSLPIERDVIFARKHGTPFYTQDGASGQRLLALVSRKNPKQYLVLRHDFYPFALSEEQKAAALAQTRAA